MSLDFDDVILRHMEDQPYEVKCSECGSILYVSNTVVDSDFDIRIEISPCQNCLDEAKEEQN